MPKNLQKIASIALGLIFLIWAANYLFNNKESLDTIQNIDIKYLAPIIILSIISIYLNGLFLKIIAKPFNIELKEHFHIAASNAFYNLFLPFRGGSLIRAIYMKKIHKQKYSHFISALIGNYIIILLSGSIIALTTFTYLYITKNIFNATLTIIFSTILIATTYLALGGKIPKCKHKVLKKINNVTNGWLKISKHPQIIPKLTINTIIAIGIEGIKIQLIFLSLNQNINLFESFFYANISLLATFINITPGSIGINEGLYMVSSSILHIPAQIGLIAALTARTINTIIVFTVGSISNILLYKRLK